MQENLPPSLSNEPLVLCLERAQAPFHNNLSGLGYKILSESDPKKALQKLKNQSIALLFLDPGVGGDSCLELLNQLRHTSPETLRILVNCTLTIDKLSEAINMGKIWNCLKTPWNPEDIEILVNEGLSEWNKRQSGNTSPLIRGDLHLQIMSSITNLFNESLDLSTALSKTVEIIAHQLHHDVVSIYIWDETKEKLVMTVTRGLRLDPVNPVMLGAHEGMTGLVFSTRTSLIATPASRHPNYKYIPELGEDRFASFIAAPILLGNRALGVLVGQSHEEQPIASAEEILFQFIASRLAGVIELAGKVGPKTSGSDTKHAGQILQGRGVGQGFAAGPVYFLRPPQKNSLSKQFSTEERELQRLIQAFTAVIGSYRLLIEDWESKAALPTSELEIFKAHLLILQDRSLLKQAQRRILESHLPAPLAIHETFSSFIHLFENHRDPYFKERAQDFRGLEQKLLDELEENPNFKTREDEFPEHAVVIAHEITPSQVPILYQKKVKAIITEMGGVTSHTAILSKSLGIPAVLGVDNVCSQITGLEHVLVDGRTGLVFINPDQILLDEYQKQAHKEAGYKSFFNDYGPQTHIPTGVAIDANIGFPGDIERAVEKGLDRVGLYRTEFTFMQFPRWPTLLEQFWIYEKAAQNFSGPIHIRTLDIGADKHLPYFAFPHEENPLLGLRSIRFSLENLDLFRDQLRAILMGVRKGYKFRILLPMVTHVWEIESVKELILQLGSEMDLSPDQLPPLGMMAEVPAILQQLDDVRPYISFVSVGTNDLTQYMLAVDRNSHVVGHLYSSFHPSIIRILYQIVKKANDLNLEVSVCGEMAGSPLGALALASLGCTRISITPSSAPVVRYLLSQLSIERAASIKLELLTLKHEREIVNFLNQQLQEIDQRLLDLNT